MNAVSTPEQRAARQRARDQLHRARAVKARHDIDAMRHALLGHDERMAFHLGRSQRCQEDIDRLEADLHRGSAR
ncbi:hypothetical protein ACPPVT_07670 [Angustibacter sp. McL0619]|uniref:hypothetical protein n=1 Tax=Angustibacter sp. McL0619 TaxID=3415676 RepID=UPI003CEAD43B